MQRKESRFGKLRADARELWNESGLQSHSELSKVHKCAHFCFMVWRSFTRNRCPVRASALAYATLLALIPMLAVAMSVTSTFLKREGEQRIDEFIVKLVSSVTPPADLDTNDIATVANPAAETADSANPADAPAAAAPSSANAIAAVTNALPPSGKEEQTVRARKEVARRINQFVQNTQSGALGVTGSIVLIFAAISMLSRIEDTFNDIWGVARGRTWFMRIVLYWGVITLAPLLLVVALGLASGPHLQSTRVLIAYSPFVGRLVFQLLPAVVLCLTFALLYMLMPNTKVRWQAALAGGLVGGLLFHLNNVVSVLYVSRVVSNSKIYGSLGLVPVFMIGLYFSWLILLFGAQVSYAFQNRASYLEERQIENINQRGREFIALRLMTCVGLRFGRGEPPGGVVEVGKELGVPTRLVQQILQTLCAARLVVEAAGVESAFVPARPMEAISCYDILLAIRVGQGQELATRDEPTRKEVFGEFNRIQEAERQAAETVSLLAMVNRAQAQVKALGPATITNDE